MPATSTSRALQGSTLRSQRSCRRSLWPLCTMNRSVAIAAPQGPPALTSQAWLQASQDRQGERDQAGEDETRIQTEQVVSSTPGL